MKQYVKILESKNGVIDKELYQTIKYEHNKVCNNGFRNDKINVEFIKELAETFINHLEWNCKVKVLCNWNMNCPKDSFMYFIFYKENAIDYIVYKLWFMYPKWGYIEQHINYFTGNGKERVIDNPDECIKYQEKPYSKLYQSNGDNTYNYWKLMAILVENKYLTVLKGAPYNFLQGWNPYDENYNYKI